MSLFVLRLPRTTRAIRSGPRVIWVRQTTVRSTASSWNTKYSVVSHREAELTRCDP